MLILANTLASGVKQPTFSTTYFTKQCLFNYAKLSHALRYLETVVFFTSLKFAEMCNVY